MLKARYILTLNSFVAFVEKGTVLRDKRCTRLSQKVILNAMVMFQTFETSAISASQNLTVTGFIQCLHQKVQHRQPKTESLSRKTWALTVYISGLRSNHVVDPLNSVLRFYACAKNVYHKDMLHANNWYYPMCLLYMYRYSDLWCLQWFRPIVVRCSFIFNDSIENTTLINVVFEMEFFVLF